MKRSYITLGVIVLFVVLGGGLAWTLRTGWISAGAKGPQSNASAAPIPVTIARVERKSWPLLLEAVGTVRPFASVALRPRIDGEIVAVAVEEGAAVRKGDPLFFLDDRLLRTQMAQIDAQIAKNRALLEQARRNRTRTETLAARGATSAASRDDAATAETIAKNDLVAALAQKESLETQLSFTRIDAPLDGRIGAVAAKPGVSVHPSDVLATINQINPIYVAFSIPQSAIMPLKEAIRRGPVSVEAIPSLAASPAFSMNENDLQNLSAQGTLAFFENAIDDASGTLPVKARMDNTQEFLWPGAFVAVRLILDVDSLALVVPSQAVQFGQNGPYAFIVGEDQNVAMVPLKIARSLGGETSISSGLKEGDRVVLQGAHRLRHGAAVSIVNLDPADNG